jgi:hypothetical protein
MMVNRWRNEMKTRITSYELDTIKAIAKRASALASANEIELDEKTVLLDLTAAMAGGCKLCVQDLLNANDVDFVHDVFGINKHLDRNTFTLTDCFVPRYAHQGFRR